MTFFQNRLSLSFLPKHCRPVCVAGTRGGETQSPQGLLQSGPSQPNLHLQGRKAWGSSSSPRRGQPSLPPGRAPLASLQRAKPGPHRAGPARPAAVAPGAPPAGMGVGPGGHRPANSRSQGESAPHPLRRPQTYLQGLRVSWTAATGQRADAEAAGSPPREPKYPGGHRAGRDAGGLPRASAARREGRGDLALPSALGRCLRRRHFGFHSVSPPPHSAAGFPDVGISRRRLRGGRGLGAFARPAASGERRPRPPARRPRLLGVSPAAPPPRAAQVTRPGACDRALFAPSPRLT